MNLREVLRFAAKNIGVFLIGAFIGMIISALYVAYVWLPASGPEFGLGIVALIVPMFIIMGLIGMVLGGFFGLLFFYLLKVFKKNRR